MISYQEALDLIYSQAITLKKHSILVESALKEICAETIACPADHPSFNQSAMDGFAVQSEKTQKASNHNPLCLTVRKKIAAGDIYLQDDELTKDTCEIMTGAVLPATYDAVIPIENVDEIINEILNLNEIKIFQPVKSKDNVRHIGEDFKKGDILLKKGQTILPQHIMALTAFGIDRIEVYKKPKIAVVCTGKELVDDTSIPLKQGQIRNVNYPYLKANLALLGIETVYYGIIPDDPDLFELTITKIINDSPEIIISTGAVSVGHWDFIPAALSKLNAKIIFHKISIRPGKPILFARLKESPYFFGLPGNPMATVVGLRFFIYPLIKRMHNLSDEKPIKARLAKDFKKKSGLKFYLRSHLWINDEGIAQVEILPEQESFKINALLKANCWVILEESSTTFQKGELVDVYPLLCSFNQPNFEVEKNETTYNK